MPSSVDRTAGEIDWPPWAERTPADERERTYKFGVSLNRALNDIDTVLEQRLEVDDWRLSTAAPHRKKDGRPYADANPDDPSAVVRWTKDGEQFAVACDRYSDLRDNIRSIGLYLEEKRKMSIRPVTTGRSEFASAKLPPGEGESDAIVSEAPPHEVLDVSPDAEPEVVKAAFRAKAKDAHPDGGGSTDRMQRLTQAKEALINAE